MLPHLFSKRVWSWTLLISMGMSVIAASPDALAATRPSPEKNAWPFAKIESQAFRTLVGKTKVRIGGPVVLPSSLPKKYWSATTEATHTDWHILLWKTARPYGVNPAGLTFPPSETITWYSEWDFGLAQLPHTPKSMASALDAHVRWTPKYDTIHSHAAHQADEVGTAEYGAWATLYPGQGQDWPLTRLVWQSGAWTVELTGSNARSEEALAYTLADYLHFHPLPSHPGLLLVTMAAAPGPDVVLAQGNTQAAWIRGRLVYTAGSSVNYSPQDPIQTVQLIESWHRFTP